MTRGGDVKKGTRTRRQELGSNGQTERAALKVKLPPTAYRGAGRGGGAFVCVYSHDTTAWVWC